MQETKVRPDVREDVKQPYFNKGTEWKWGFTPSAEIWNGRLAMVGFLAATLVELFTNHGYLRLLGFLTGTDVTP
jgi:hypothetical protein